MTPPSLAWLNLFRDSTGTALDQNIVVDVQGTVNLLVYRVHIRFGEAVSMKNAVLVWNIFQKWAGANETVPYGKVDFQREVSPFSKDERVSAMTLSVQIKHRLGPEKTDRP